MVGGVNDDARRRAQIWALPPISTKIGPAWRTRCVLRMLYARCTRIAISRTRAAAIRRREVAQASRRYCHTATRARASPSNGSRLCGSLSPLPRRVRRSLAPQLYPYGIAESRSLRCVTFNQLRPQRHTARHAARHVAPRSRTGYNPPSILERKAAPHRPTYRRPCSERERTLSCALSSTRDRDSYIRVRVCVSVTLCVCGSVAPW